MSSGQGLPLCAACNERVTSGTTHTVMEGGKPRRYHPNTTCCPRCRDGERPYVAPAGKVAYRRVVVP